MFTDGDDDFYGVIRIDVMRRIAPHNSYHNAGRKLAAELSLYGRFQQVPEVMFWRRQHAGRGDNLGSIKRVCTNLDPRRRSHSTARPVGRDGGRVSDRDQSCAIVCRRAAPLLPGVPEVD